MRRRSRSLDQTCVSGTFTAKNSRADGPTTPVLWLWQTASTPATAALNESGLQRSAERTSLSLGALSRIIATSACPVASNYSITDPPMYPPAPVTSTRTLGTPSLRRSPTRSPRRAPGNQDGRHPGEQVRLVPHREIENRDPLGGEQLWHRIVGRRRTGADGIPLGVCGDDTGGPIAPLADRFAIHTETCSPGWAASVFASFQQVRGVGRPHIELALQVIEACPAVVVL